MTSLSLFQQPWNNAKACLPLFEVLMAHSDLTSVESLPVTTTNSEQGKDAAAIMDLTSNAEEGEAKPKPTISSLPPELHLKIFKCLDRTSSVCFGLTARKLYLIHKELRGIVSLAACCLRFPSRGGERGRILCGLLRGWMAGAGLVFSAAELKYITPETKLKAKEDDLIWRFYNWGSFDQSPMAKKLANSKEKRRLKRLRDEKEAGGWWEKGVWIDGEESGKGAERWVELACEGVEFEGIGDGGNEYAWI